MQRLSSHQIKLLERALSIGVLSPTKHAEVLQWQSAQTRAHLEDLEWRRENPEPVRPRLATEMESTKLAREISLRDIALAERLPAGPERERKMGELKSRLLIIEQARPERTREPGARRAGRARTYGPREECGTALPIVVSTALALMGEVQSLEEAIGSSMVACSISPPALSGHDVELCATWANLAPALDSNEEHEDDSRRGWDRHVKGRLFSARAAELAMQIYYRALGFSVEDVSVQQLAGSNADWKDFDLKVDDRLIDVKNARQSLNGNGRFVEHCVPIFKQHRGTNEQVIIAGVVSKYLADPAAYSEGSHAAMVLGEVQVEDVRAVYRWARGRFGERLDLKGVWNKGFLPGWLFEYSDAHYASRRRAIAKIGPLAWALAEAGALGDRLPGWMLVLSSDGGFVRSLPLSEPKRALVGDLRQIDEMIGLTRRSIFVYAMGLAVESLANRIPPSDILRQLVSLLVVRNEWSEAPSILGLSDPMQYVFSMVDALCSIGQKIIDLDIHVVGFRLTHPAILKGVRADGSLLTLLAYCGGWQTFPINGKCGTTPLSIADQETCEACAHLVCHNCGHCSKKCDMRGPRQDELIRARMPGPEPTFQDDDPWERHYDT